MESSLVSALIILLVVVVVIAAITALKYGISLGKIITITVSIILLGVLVPFMTDDSSNAEPSITEISTMAYDDYIACEPSLVIDDGPLELVTINGKTYAHANGIGDATIHLGSIQNTITVNKAVLDVFMIAGQSNAEHGIYNRVDADPKGILGTTYYYGTATQVLKYSSGYDVDNYAIYDMVGTEVYPIAANVDLPFAASYYKLTGHKVLVLNAGVAGSAVLSWTPGKVNYEFAKNVFNDMLSKIDTDFYDFTVKSYIWIQGEADSGTSVSTYKTRFMEMHNSFTGADPDNVFSDTPFENCLISKVREKNGINSSKAELQLSRSYDTVIMATTLADKFTMANGLMLGDDLHYSQLGDNALGEAIAECAAKID